MRVETKQSVILVLGTGITTLLSLAYTTYVARTLGKAVAADFFAAVALAAFCQIALGPINGTVAKFTADFAGRGELGKVRSLHRAMTRRVAIYGCVFALLGLIFLAPLTRLLQFESSAPLVITIGTVYATLLLSVTRGLLRGLQYFGRLNWNMIFESASRLALGCLILFAWSGATAGLTAYLVSLLVTLALSQFQLRELWRDNAPEPIDGRAIRQFTGPMWLMMGVYGGIQNIDMLYVKHLFPDVDAGIYGAAFSLTRWVSAMVTPFNILLLPLLSTLHSEGRGIVAPFLRIAGYCTLLVAIPIGVFAVWPTEIMVALCGEEYARAGALLVPLSISRFAGHLCQMIALACAATNNFRFLYPYALGLALLAGVLSVWHDTLQTVVYAAIIVQFATFIAMAMLFVVIIRGRREAQANA